MSPQLPDLLFISAHAHAFAFSTQWLRCDDRIYFVHSMGLCSMRGHPTQTCMCMSGQQRRRMTLEWCSRWRCVKLKVRGKKEAVKGDELERECGERVVEMKFGELTKSDSSIKSVN